MLATATAAAALGIALASDGARAEFSCPLGTAVTDGGFADPGTPCEFPFTFRGTKYSSCVALADAQPFDDASSGPAPLPESGEEPVYWCATVSKLGLRGGNKKKWGYCACSRPPTLAPTTRGLANFTSAPTALATPTPTTGSPTTGSPTTLATSLEPTAQPTAQPTTTPPNDHPANDHPANDHPANDHPANDHPANDHPANDHPANDHPANDHPANDHPANDHPANDHPANDHPANDHPANDHLAHNHPRPQPPRPQPVRRQPVPRLPPLRHPQPPLRHPRSSRAPRPPTGKPDEHGREYEDEKQQPTAAPSTAAPSGSSPPTSPPSRASEATPTYRLNPAAPLRELQVITTMAFGKSFAGASDFPGVEPVEDLFEAKFGPLTSRVAVTAVTRLSPGAKGQRRRLGGTGQGRSSDAPTKNAATVFVVQFSMHTTASLVDQVLERLQGFKDSRVGDAATVTTVSVVDVGYSAASEVEQLVGVSADGTVCRTDPGKVQNSGNLLLPAALVYAALGVMGGLFLAALAGCTCACIISRRHRRKRFSTGASEPLPEPDPVRRTQLKKGKTVSFAPQAEEHEEALLSTSQNHKAAAGGVIPLTPKETFEVLSAVLGGAFAGTLFSLPAYKRAIEEWRRRKQLYLKRGAQPPPIRPEAQMPPSQSIPEQRFTLDESPVDIVVEPSIQSQDSLSEPQKQQRWSLRRSLSRGKPASTSSADEQSLGSPLVAGDLPTARTSARARSGRGSEDQGSPRSKPTKVAPPPVPLRDASPSKSAAAGTPREPETEERMHTGSKRSFPSEDGQDNNASSALDRQQQQSQKVPERSNPFEGFLSRFDAEPVEMPAATTVQASPVMRGPAVTFVPTTVQPKNEPSSPIEPSSNAAPASPQGVEVAKETTDKEDNELQAREYASETTSRGRLRNESVGSARETAAPATPELRLEDDVVETASPGNRRLSLRSELAMLAREAVAKRRNKTLGGSDTPGSTASMATPPRKASTTGIRAKYSTRPSMAPSSAPSNAVGTTPLLDPPQKRSRRSITRLVGPSLSSTSSPAAARTLAAGKSGPSTPIDSSPALQRAVIPSSSRRRLPTSRSRHFQHVSVDMLLDGGKEEDDGDEDSML